MRKIISFFDRLEDTVRFRLSRYPILYAFLAGVGTVLFFRGVWLITDELTFMTGPVTLALSLGLLLITGSFVYHFIGDTLLLNAAKRQKKVSERLAHQRKRKR